MAGPAQAALSPAAAAAAPTIGSGGDRAAREGERFADLELQATECSPAKSVRSQTTAASTNPTSAESKAGGDGRRCSPKRWGACGLAAAALLALGVVFRPRNAAWDLTELRFDPALLTGLTQAFTDPAFNSTLLFPISVTAAVRNPNFIGARAGAARLRVTSGDFVIADVQTEPGVIHAHGQSLIRAVSTSTITPEVSRHLMSVLPPLFKLSPEVRGEIPARVFGFINVKVKLHCTVEVEVLSILSDPVKMVTAYRCSQGLGF